MIASLQGVVADKDAEGVILECGGVGYGVAMSLSSLAGITVGQTLRVLVYTHLTQEALRLFGFRDAEEKRLFEVLLGITGVGPRLALAVLSTFAPADLAEAVANSDLAALVRVPGVGKKKAERLLLELRDKLDRLGASGQVGARRGPVADLVSALVNLGFDDEVADHAARQAMQENPDEQDLATLVRAALRATGKR